VVSLVVASRALLRRHFFYQMLKNGVIVRLESRSPLRDPMFYFLVWCLVHVLGHFVSNLFQAGHANIEQVSREMSMELMGIGTKAQKRLVEPVSSSSQRTREKRRRTLGRRPSGTQIC